MLFQVKEEKKIAFKYKLIPNERVKGQLIWE